MNPNEISDYCEEKTGFTIGSNDVGSPASANSIFNVQDCRTYCTSINGATHFTFTPQSGQSWGNCECKSSQSPLNAMNGAISGKVICTPTTSTTTTTTASTTTTTTTTTTSTTTTAATGRSVWYSKGRIRKASLSLFCRSCRGGTVHPKFRLSIQPVVWWESEDLPESSD